MLLEHVFQNEDSHAVGISQEIKTEGKDHLINKSGEGNVIYPKDDPWAQARSIVGTFPEDFMSHRSQPDYTDEREEF